MFGHKLHGDVFEGHEELNSLYPLSPLGSHSGLPFGEGAFSGVSLSHPFSVSESDFSSSGGDNSTFGLSDPHSDALSLSMPLTSTASFDAAYPLHQLASAFPPTFDTFDPLYQQESAFAPSSSSSHLACAPAPESASSFVLKVEPLQELAPSSTSEVGGNSQAHSDDASAQTSAQGSASMTVSSHHEQEKQKQKHKLPKIDLFFECKHVEPPSVRVKSSTPAPEIAVAIVNEGDPEDVVTYKKGLNMALTYLVEKFDLVINNRRIHIHLDTWLKDAKEEYEKQYLALKSSHPLYTLVNDCFTNIEQAFSRPGVVLHIVRAELKKYVNKNVADLREIVSYLTETNATKLILPHVVPFKDSDFARECLVADEIRKSKAEEKAKKRSASRHSDSYTMDSSVSHSGMALVASAHPKPQASVQRPVQGLVPMAVDSSHEQKKQGQKRKRQEDVFNVFEECNLVEDGKLVESPYLRSKTLKLPPEIKVAIVNAGDSEAVAAYKKRLNMILSYLVERFEIFHGKRFNAYLDGPMKMARKQYRDQYQALESSHPFYRLANDCLSNIEQAFLRPTRVMYSAQSEIRDYVNENVADLRKIVSYLTETNATKLIPLLVVPFEDSDFGRKYPSGIKRRRRTGNDESSNESSTSHSNMAPVGSSVSHSGAPFGSSLASHSASSFEMLPAEHSAAAVPVSMPVPSNFAEPSSVASPLRGLSFFSPAVVSAPVSLPSAAEQAIERQLRDAEADAKILNEIIKRDLQLLATHQQQLRHTVETSQQLAAQLSMLRNGTSHSGLFAQPLGELPQSSVALGQHLAKSAPR